MNVQFGQNIDANLAKLFQLAIRKKSRAFEENATETKLKIYIERSISYLLSTCVNVNERTPVYIHYFLLQ